MIGTSIRSSFGILILLASLSLGAEAPHVHNSAEPVHGLQTMQLEEMWRAGGPDDEDTLFGHVVRVLGDEQGHTYVLDAQLQKVNVYGPDGSLINVLFGDGEGPGELRFAMDLVLLPDDEVGAVRRFPGGMVLVKTDGTPVGTLGSNKPGRAFAAAAYGGGHLVLAEVESIEHDDGTHTRQSRLGPINEKGERLATCLQSDRHVDYQNNFTFDERQALVDFLYSFDVGPDGRIYALADADRYAIHVFAPDGTLERVIEREYEPRRRTDEEMKRIEALVERRLRTFPFDKTIVLAETMAVVPWFYRGIQVTDDGSLWVRHARSGELGRQHDALIVFDVFDPAGRFDRQVAVPVEGNDLTTGVFLVGDDRLVVVRGFVDAMRSVVGGGQGSLDAEDAEPDPVEVICYHINRR